MTDRPICATVELLVCWNVCCIYTSDFKARDVLKLLATIINPVDYFLRRLELVAAACVSQQVIDVSYLNVDHVRDRFIEEW